jgi:predicted HTH transcriptional regulator
LIAEPLFRVQYVEKAGTGTTDMIADCRDAGLPEPDFEQRGPHFVVTLWRDWLTTAVLDVLGLNARQKQAVTVIKSVGHISNADYQRITGASRPTAIRDLATLVQKGVFIRRGAARSAHYVLGGKRLKNDSND